MITINRFQRNKCIDVTSQSKTWAKRLSPFFIKAGYLYHLDEKALFAKNVENAWQFSKVYKEHLDKKGEPSYLYWKWAFEGWADNYAHRYPMGKGKKPYAIYIARANSYGEPVLAKPCEICQMAIKDAKIKEIHYTE